MIFSDLASCKYEKVAVIVTKVQGDAQKQVGLILLRIDAIADETQGPTEQQSGEKVGELQQKLNVPRRQRRRSQSVLAIFTAVD